MRVWGILSSDRMKSKKRKMYIEPQVETSRRSIWQTVARTVIVLCIVALVAEGIFYFLTYRKNIDAGQSATAAESVAQQEIRKGMCTTDVCSTIGMGVVTAVDGSVVTYDLVPAVDKPTRDATRFAQKLDMMTGITVDIYDFDKHVYIGRNVRGATMRPGDRFYVMTVNQHSLPTHIVILPRETGGRDAVQGTTSTKTSPTI